MKLASAQYKGIAFLGIELSGVLVPASQLLDNAPKNVMEWILASESMKSALAEAVKQVDATALLNAGKAYSMEDELLRFLPLIEKPQKIICVGLNYKTHILEMKHELPEHPVIFAKYPNVLAGHKEVIPLPKVSHKVDYEAEMAFIIAKRAKSIQKVDALDYVAGYTMANDISVRDYQARTIQFLQGKTFDKAGPIGPVLVTPSEMRDISKETITLRLNGEVMQHSPLSDLLFPVEELIERFSEFMTLEPGDIILTGTPGGVGVARSPRVWLKDGDKVEVEISHIGVLENSFKA